MSKIPGKNIIDAARNIASNGAHIFARAEKLLITLVRGKVFFTVSRFIRNNGSLSAVIVIALFVTTANLSAKNSSESLDGFYSSGAGAEIIKQVQVSGQEDGTGISDVDDSTMQQALGTDIETRKEVALEQAPSTSDDLVVDSADLFVYGVDAETGELSAEVELYTVEKGDTLAIIARNNDISINTLLWANDITNKDKITPGDTLFILPITGVKYKVRASDTIKSIAAKYKADPNEIIAFNELPANGEVKSGQEIIVPGGQIAPPPRQVPVTVATAPSILSGRAEISAATKGQFAHPLPGMRVKTQNIHPTNAVDLAAPLGTKIYAVEKGRVTKVLNNGWGGGYGKHVVITHPNGLITLYAHLSQLDVQKGQSVKKGQLIGRVGSTGRSTGPHLHFEIRGANAPRNPF